MVRLYSHRINTLAALDRVAPTTGIEFDLRSDGARVIVTHDPFTDGPTIEEFFPRIGARPCIFNVKCEGIESRVMELAATHGIEDFFFLDCSIPAAMKLSRAGENRFAVRWSEVEPIEGVLAWADRARWVWVDCFDAYPGSDDDWARVTSAFDVCLVSPELQGHGEQAIPRFRDAVANYDVTAICSKFPERWIA
jgi:hypothetical protein